MAPDEIRQEIAAMRSQLAQYHEEVVVYFERSNERINTCARDISDLQHDVYGNGRDGLKDRTTRLEERDKEMQKLKEGVEEAKTRGYWEIVKMLCAAAVAVFGAWAVKAL